MNTALSGCCESKIVTLDGIPLSIDEPFKGASQGALEFDWGKANSGSAALSVAILYSILRVGFPKKIEGVDNAEAQAMLNFREFQRQVIAHFPKEDFSRSIDVESWLLKHMPMHLQSDFVLCCYQERLRRRSISSNGAARRDPETIDRANAEL